MQVEVQKFIQARDFQAAKSVLKYDKDKSIYKDLVIAYLHYLLGEYEEAGKMYKEISYLDSAKYQQYATKEQLRLYANICLFHLRSFQEVKLDLDSIPNQGLGNRLKLHLFQRMGDEEQVLKHHGKLQDVIEDHLTLASMHFVRGHYQEALKIFKKLMAEHPDRAEIGLYAGLAYYKLEFYDKAMLIADSFMQKSGPSFIATNLKACCLYKLYKVQEAEALLNTIVNVYPKGFNRIIQHNLALILNDDMSLKSWNDCTKYIPEASINIVIHHLKHGEVMNAKEVVDKIQPAFLEELIIKAACLTEYGQEYESTDALKQAATIYESIGSTDAEKNTILGRQSMSNYMFIVGNYEESNVYLDSIKSFMAGNDSYYFNAGQVKMRIGEYEAAVELLSQVKQLSIRQSWIYIATLAKSRTYCSPRSQCLHG